MSVSKSYGKYVDRFGSSHKCYPPTSVQISRGMIVHDSPAIFELAENEREFAFGIIAGTLQFPASEHHGGVFGEHRYFQIRKGEGSHSRPAGIAAFIIFKRRGPSPGYSFGYENELVGIPITLHETFYVTAVPRCGLGVHNSCYVLGGFLLLRFRLSEGKGAKNKYQCADKGPSHI